MAVHRLTLFLFCLLVLSASVDSKDASTRLRGKNFEALERRVRNPDIDAHIRGKTLKEFGIEQSINRKEQSRRKTQVDDDSSVTFKYFTVYDEFDTSSSKLGETAGSRGMIYHPSAKDSGLMEEYVEGALQGTCSVVSSDGVHLCSYEFFFLNPSTGTLGTVVATGSVKLEVDKKSILIIEATGDDFVRYKGGMVTINYMSIGGQTVMDLDLTMRH